MSSNDVTVVQYKAGGYTIPAMTSQAFTFWWGPDAVGNEYFDISIGPDPKIAEMIPLIEKTGNRTLQRNTSSKYADIDTAE